MGKPKISDTLEGWMYRLHLLKGQIKTLQAEEKKLKPKIQAEIQRRGEVINEAGSQKITEGKFSGEWRIRETIKVLDTAEQVLKDEEVWNLVCTEVLDEDKLVNAVEEGIISVDTFNAITETKKSGALYITEEKEDA